LQAAHPDLFEREALKLALGIHTRSTRYLQSVAEGKPRHDLQGQPVEAMAPEHIHQALLEVHRRRQGRSAEDLQPKLVARIVRAIQASGLTREEYAERMHSRDEAANAVLAEALAALAALQAREEALLRAYEASGKTVAEFADMYGMDPRTAERSLHNARQRAAAPAPDAAA
jgi:sRNA-binding protein